MSRAPSILIVDDHPALRAGLHGLLEQEPGLSLAGAVSDEPALMRAVADTAPDVVVLDYALGRADGLSVCFRLKQRADAPGVVLYTAYADEAFAVPAAVAQADAIVSKSEPVDALLAAIRDVAAGRILLPQPDPELLQAASARLVEDDLPVLGMLLARIPVREIAHTIGSRPEAVRARALRVIGGMQASDRIRPSLRRRDAEHAVT
jgi:DNA-binding NarL/FixJ family response regulator